MFLKIDTQGHELSVLEGAEAVLGAIAGVSLELSISPIYDKQPPMDEVMRWMRTHGFTLWMTKRGLYDKGSKRELEMDGLFLRK